MNAIAGARTKGAWRPAFGWTTFDMATSLFSFNVSIYLSQWVVNNAHGTDSTWALAVSLSTALVVFLAPVLGAVSDLSGRRMPFLIAATLVIAAATAALGSGGLVVTMLIFGAGNVAYLCGNVFYNALLPAVSTDANRGRMGGYAAALGAFGSLLGIAVGLVILSNHPQDKTTLFRISGAMFFLFALPCLFFVRDHAASHVHMRAGQVLGATKEVFETLRHVRRYEGLGPFLVARGLYSLSLSTIGVFLAIYVVDQVGFTPAQMQLLSLLALVTAVAGSVAWGRVVDRLGPKRSLDLVLLVWAAAFAATAGFAYLHPPKGLFWAVGVLTGLALGGAPTADRPYLLRLSPPRLVGEFYGLYATVGLVAAVIGPLVWTLIANGLGLGRPAAVLALLACVVAALVLLRVVSDAPRDWSEEDNQATPQLLPHREHEPLLGQSLLPTASEGRVFNPAEKTARASTTASRSG